MYRRILLSMMAFGLAAFLMGGATMAWFTDSKASSVTIQSGTVTIGVSDPSGPLAPVTWSANYNNMAPDQTITSTMTIKNAGSLPMKYRVWADIVTGSDAGLAGLLKIGVTESDGITILLPERALTTFDSSVAVVRNGTHVLAKDATENLMFNVRLPADAGNLVAGKQVMVIFHFDATQPENPGWTQN